MTLIEVSKSEDPYTASAKLVAASVALGGVSVLAKGNSEVPECISGTETTETSDFEGRTLITTKCEIPVVSAKERALGGYPDLVERDINICGAPCTTYCNGGTGGPNPNDCTALASAIQNDGGQVIKAGTKISYTLDSCQGYILNSDNTGLYYCTDQSNLAGIINYVAWHCQASTPGGPYQGGSCHYYDNTGIGWSGVNTA